MNKQRNIYDYWNKISKSINIDKVQSNRNYGKDATMHEMLGFLSQPFIFTMIRQNLN